MAELAELAELADEARHHAFLGQAHAEAGQWSEALSAFPAALKGKDLEDPNGIRAQLGTARINTGRLSEARRVSIAASESDKHGPMASNRIKSVGAEIERKRVAEQMPQTLQKTRRRSRPTAGRWSRSVKGRRR